MYCIHTINLLNLIKHFLSFIGALFFFFLLNLRLGLIIQQLSLIIRHFGPELNFTQAMSQHFLRH